MSADVKLPGYISMPNFMPCPPNDLTANAQKPENVGTNFRKDVLAETGGGTNDGPEGILISPSNLVHDNNMIRKENFKMSEK